MANRDVKVRLLADPSGFKQGFLEAGKSMRVAQREAYKMEQAQRQMHDAFNEIGPVVMGAGVAIAAALGYAAKAAVDWESAWANVEKTVDGTPEQMADLEKQIRGLAKVLPQTHAEIAGVAAAAGQLGIAREDIVDFTTTMVAMGVATNLSSEEAATSLARMMNIMQTAPNDIGKLGATIVDLGNNAATTEAEILAMGLRIAGAGATLGLSEAQVLAFSTALSSVGIEAEAGGSAISTFMLRLGNDISTGNKRVQQFADVAGMSVQQFSELFRTDAAGAIDAFISGLSGMRKSGGDVNATLTELGITEIRQRDAVMRLANANGILTEQLTRANDAWADGSALIEEAAKRYQTTESQMAIARNRVNDLAISFGEYLLPILGEVANFIGGLADTFAALPGPVKQVLTVIGLAGAAIGIFGGAAMLAIPKIAAFNAALGAMDNKLSRGIQRGASGVAAVFTGPWGAALTVATAVLGMFLAEAASTEATIRDIGSTLDEQTGAITVNTHAWIANELEKDGLLSQANAMGISTGLLTRAILGEKDALEEVNAVLDKHRYYTNDAGTKMFRLGENTTQHTEAATNLSTKLGELIPQEKDATEEGERLAEANAEAALQAGGLSASEQVLADKLGLSADKAKEASGALSDMDTELNKLLNTLWSVEDAEAALTLAIDRATEATEKNGATLDTTTKAGADNHGVVKDLASAYIDLAMEQVAASATMEEAEGVIAELKAAFEDQMRAMGYSEEEIQKYAAAFDNIPSVVETVVEIRQKIYDPTSSSEGKIHGGGGRNPAAFFSTGGYVSGPGGPTDDRVPAWLSNGEYVINAKATRNNRELLDVINRGGTGRVATSPEMYSQRGHVAPIGAGSRQIVIEKVEVVASKGYEFDIKDVERALSRRGIG